MPSPRETTRLGIAYYKQYVSELKNMHACQLGLPEVFGNTRFHYLVSHLPHAFVTIAHTVR